jgi:hypothetical protein
MAVTRDRWLIGLAGVVVILVVLCALYLVTERNRAAAVVKLESKRAAVSALRMTRQSPPERQGTRERASGPQALATAKSVSPSEDTVAAYGRLFEKKKAIQDNPSWKEAIEVIGKKNPKGWTEAERKKVAEFLAANREVIRELIRLAESGGPVYELDYSKGFNMELPHLAQLRDCARLLAADAAWMAGERNYGEAVESTVAGMKLANALDNEPILISQLVRLAMDGIMYNTVEGAIQGEDLTPDLAGRLIAYAANAGGREAFANAFTSEGLFGLDAFEGIRTGDLASAGMVPSATDSVLLRVYGSPFARPWLNMDEETYADIIGRMGDAARLPFYEAKPLLDQVERDVGDLPRTRFLSRTLLPAITRVGQSQAVHETRMDLMRVGLAVEQYHAQNGAYPETLEQVAPTLGGAAPLDPFTGQPYGYQPSGGSFLLYGAVGRPHWQGADDQGRLVWRGPR